MMGTTGRLCSPGEGLTLKYIKSSGVESALSGLSNPGDSHPNQLYVQGKP